MTDQDPSEPQENQSPATRPGGLEAPQHPALDPNQKTDATHDPTAGDPGNGAD
ncbi:hypothetical protein [Caulobacter endophyticus]|uniref:hypothetical protein n=1 Tax=Caulobacter endophyticus TaxID=2172652 RepID=UPI001304AE6D|nr:hypothetical protein [Caulobacter endophyticus]